MTARCAMEAFVQGLLAKPRGFCAGVERAIRVVELALEQYGSPVYVRKEIVHNSHVVARLRREGAVFIDELHEAPEGALTILSAHGSPPEVYAEAKRRGLRVIDATCPLVTKVHKEVALFVRRGYRILLIGHAGHDEVVGTMGQAPRHTTLIETLADVERLSIEPGEKAVILTQTTLSQDDTREIVDALRSRFQWLELPPKEDICYATQNRQNAVKEIVGDIDLLLVVGSANSSNSRRLTEVATSRGVASYLVDGPDDIDPAWLQSRSRIAVSSGASAPETIVQDVIHRLRSLGVDAFIEVDAPDENVVFSLPRLTQLTKGGVTAIE
ncbi:MAG: 4-hydroxy-3-methylbut-2-enyl diphosphate reductase [Phycisphaerales bacterium]|nr:4-hydroxy-3-methylbut-2-enyl diphosphate reductase [Phycisphaerales bacterium]